MNAPSTTGPRRRSRAAARPHTNHPPAGRTFNVTGSYSAHPRGFGFLNLDTPVKAGDDTITDAFVTPGDTPRLMTGDQLAATIRVAAGRATVTKVTGLIRTRTSVFGRLRRTPAGLLVEADPTVTSGPVKVTGCDAADGTWVLVDLDADPSQPGRVRETYSDLDPYAVRALLFARHEVPLGHSREVLAEVPRLVGAARRRLERAPEPGRVDLTGLPTITIDGPSTRDLDDAISVTETADGLRVWVHIADVATHVPAGSATDLAAAQMPTSIYLPGWNRPMLPAELSEQTLSLLPGAPRDTLTVAFTVTDTGHVADVDVFRARIVSDARLTYTATSAYLDNPSAGGVDEPAAAVLTAADTAAGWLGTARDARDTLPTRYDHTSPQTATVVTTDAADPYQGATFAVAAAGQPVRTELLIERLMVAANEAVAGWLIERDLPGVFRVHGAPSQDLVTDAAAYVSFGPRSQRAPLAAGTDPVAVITELADRLAGDDAGSYAVNVLLMRHLNRAVYTATAGRHFGLSSAGYVHFTSPLRRRADLLVHRVIEAHLDGDTATVNRLRETLPEDAETITDRTGPANKIMGQFGRIATAAVFAADAAPLTAVVSGFNAKAAYVEDPVTGLSGSVPVSALPGTWKVDDHQVAARDAATGNVVRIGDPIRVQVCDVDLVTCQVTFARATKARPARRRRAA